MNQSLAPHWGKTALKLLGVKKVNSKALEIQTCDDVPCGIRAEVLSAAKHHLLQALIEATGDQAIVLSKVRLVDFLFLHNGNKDMDAAVQLDRYHVDFLLVNPDSRAPLAVVEFIETDKARVRHLTKRQTFIASALQSSGITVLRIRERHEYPVEVLRRKLLPRLLEAASLKSTDRDATIESSS